VVSLGCAKNLVDTEVMCGQLATAGFVLTNQPEAADVMLVNTCSFVADARAESDREIRAALRWKRRRRGRTVVVAGCLPQRDPDETLGLYPEADLLLGLDDVPRAAERIQALLERRPGERTGPDGAPPTYLYDHETPRLLLTPRNCAYVKIAEGCDHRCTFCAIPAIRGRQRSRPTASIVEECENLLRQGVKELNLIAQDTTRYGRDRDDGANLAELLRRCDEFGGEYWVRVLYTHPRHVTDEFLDVLAAGKHVAPYLDVPLQHVSDHVLRAMGRGTTGGAVRDLVAKVRKRCPKAALRTTFLVGFPGETEDDFHQLLRFAAGCRFDRLGAFAFSPEKDTPAAGITADLVPPETARARRARLLEQQQAVSLELNRALIGASLTVLVDHAEGSGRFAGRTTADAPEIDNLVHFRGPEGCLDRGFVEVRITDASAYDLHGELCDGGRSGREPVTENDSAAVPGL